MICAINPRTAPAEMTLRSAASTDRAVSTAIVIRIEAKIRIIALSRVAGFARQHAEIDADLLQCPLVFCLGVLAEDEFEIGRPQPLARADEGERLADVRCERPAAEHEIAHEIAEAFGASERNRLPALVGRPAGDVILQTTPVPANAG